MKLMFDFTSWRHFLQNDPTYKKAVNSQLLNNFAAFAMRFKKGNSKYGRITNKQSYMFVSLHLHLQGLSEDI